MSKKSNKAVIAIAGLVILIVVVFGGMSLTQNIGKSDREISAEESTASIEEMAKRVNPGTAEPVKSPIEYDEIDDAAAELPDLDDSSIAADKTTKAYAEIFAPSNIAGTGTDAWMADLANEFNKSGAQVDGQDVSVLIRNVPSGRALDYISSGKATPTAFCPSNNLWVAMLDANGVKTNTVRESLVKDVAGVLLDEEHQNAIVEKYGTVDMKAITESVSNGELAFGYTNPFTSATGMNFLISTLLRYDSKNPLSPEAAEGFRSFQANVPLVSLTTQQMVKASQNGTLNGFVNEYQVYSKDAALQAQYHFTPFGYRHDYPLVTMDSAPELQKEIIELFAKYCDENGAELAEADGFNKMNDYKPELPKVDGKTLVAAEQFYKKNKDVGNGVACVFVADVSGSMMGAPLDSLKASLVNSMKYINSDNYIGLVTYASDVTINVPIAQFDMEQQTLFKGAVDHLDANGGTATFDAIVVAADMLNKFKADNPNVKPILFVLSDGETNEGFTLNDIKSEIKGLGIPIYTIGYNADIQALQQIADINEAASINADTDDVTYQLKTLFNANM